MLNVQSFSTPSKRRPRFEPTDRLSERKRALFPTTTTTTNNCNDSDSDLGHISPLDYANTSSPDSSPERNNRRYLYNLLHSNKNDAEETKCSNLFERIYDDEDVEEILATDTQIEVVPETPTKESPTQILKTPHDNHSNNIKSQIPRLIRKSFSDLSNLDKINLKRKSDSPQYDTTIKQLKFDTSINKAPKARTALFVEEIIFPAKLFYPKFEEKQQQQQQQQQQEEEKTIHSNIGVTGRKPKSLVYLCNRNRGKKKRCFGQINAGVRHGIKKPKHKHSVSKTQLLKAALSIVENSPLNEYLDKLDNDDTISLEQLNKMDSVMKQIDVEGKQYNNNNNITVKCNSTTTTIDEQIKRPSSPQQVNKKFFKSTSSSSRTATVTISKNVKLKYEHGDLSLIEEKSCKKISKRNTNDFNEDENDKILNNNDLTNILNSLNNDSAEDIKMKNDMLLSPTSSLVCDMTSGLILDSPETESKKRISFSDTDTKLFPIFYGNKNNPSPAVKESRYVKSVRKIWKPLSNDQTIIDAGQKRFGATQCQQCKLVYSIGEPEDEILHYQHHHSIGVFKYNGWKNERIVSQFDNADKIIQINPQDSKTWWHKVTDLVDVINRELGFVDVTFDITNTKVFLYIRNKQIIGCVVTEPKCEAYKLLDVKDVVDQCSEEAYPVKCGISRIWVMAAYRKQGIATKLLNAVRSHFVYAHILPLTDLAFSIPTEDGKKFATNYMKTNEFFVYYY